MKPLEQIVFSWAENTRKTKALADESGKHRRTKNALDVIINDLEKYVTDIESNSENAQEWRNVLQRYLTENYLFLHAHGLNLRTIDLMVMSFVVGAVVAPFFDKYASQNRILTGIYCAIIISLGVMDYKHTTQLAIEDAIKNATDKEIKDCLALAWKKYFC